MSHQTDQLINNDQVSNQMRFNVCYVAACLCVCVKCLYIKYLVMPHLCIYWMKPPPPVCGITVSLCLYSPILCVCAFPPRAPSWLLANTACVVPPFQIHSHSSLDCAWHQQEGERKQKSQLPVRTGRPSTQWNRKCLATVREAMECEGKIKWSLHPIKCSFFPGCPSHVCHFPSPYLSGLDLRLFIFSSCPFLQR